MSNIPVVNLGSEYVNGFALSWTSNTTLTMTAGLCRDATDTWDIVIPAVSTIIDSAVIGLNGLDTGVLAASTSYAIWAIGDSTYNHPSGFLLSTSVTAPYMPYGYDVKRRVGWARTDGSTHFILMYQEGLSSDRTYWYDAPISVLSGGASATYVALDLSAAVPALSKTAVTFQATYRPAVAGNTATIRPSGSASTTFASISGAVAAVGQKLQVTCPCLIVAGVAKVDYVVVASDALTLLVSSFRDHL
jgi:hypothetical protein